MRSSLARLIRPYVSLAVGLSTLAGVLFSARSFDSRSILAFGGTFLLTSAVSVLNQIQERERDALMERTRTRPLVTGELSIVHARLLVAILILFTALLLWPLYGWGTLVVIGLVMGLYNGLYTPLKPRSGWAMIPGAICGALPVWIGWVGGGGAVWATTPVYFFTVYFLWQMPHFWMLAESHAQDYAAAGFAIPATSFSGYSRRAIPRLWAAAFALSTCLAFFIGAVEGGKMQIFLFPAAGAYLYAVCTVGPQNLRRLSDIFLLFFMLCCLMG